MRKQGPSLFSAANSCRDAKVAGLLDGYSERSGSRGAIWIAFDSDRRKLLNLDFGTGGMCRECLLDFGSEGHTVNREQHWRLNSRKILRTNVGGPWQRLGTRMFAQLGRHN